LQVLTFQEQKRGGENSFHQVQDFLIVSSGKVCNFFGIPEGSKMNKIHSENKRLTCNINWQLHIELSRKIIERLTE
jgi:hypothetical protein